LYRRDGSEPKLKVDPQTKWRQKETRRNSRWHRVSIVLDVMGR